jgi:hypothetical protein
MTLRLRVPRDAATLLAAAGAMAALVIAVRPALHAFDGHDVYWHLSRAAQWHRGVTEGVLYPRFFHDVFWGHGGPVMLFYSPLPYAVTEIFMLLGAGPVAALGWAVGAAFVCGAAGIFVLARGSLGTAGALVASAAYTLAPYHLLDAWVRAAYPELLAMGVTPWVVWAAARTARDRTRPAASLLAVMSALLILSHNLSAGFGLPLAAAYGLWHGHRAGTARKSAAWLAAGLAGGLLLSAFYWVPAQLEIDEIRIQEFSAGKLEAAAHLVYPQQLLDPEWGFGGSVPGPDDTMSFQVGLLHALAIAGAAFLAFRGPAASRPEIRFWLAVFGITTVLLSQLAYPLWKAAPPIPFLFPWRLLAISTVAASWTAGALLLAARTKAQRGTIAGIVPCLALLLYSPFAATRPSPYDDSFFTPEALAAERGAELLWLPRDANPPQWAPAVVVVRGDASVDLVLDRTHRLVTRVHARSPAVVRARILHFAGWRATRNGETISVGRDETGAITFEVPPGDHTVQLAFGETPLRGSAAAVSVAACLVLLFGLRRNRIG